MSGCDEYHRELISGERKGAGAALLRGALSVAEPFYAATVRLRNRMFDAGIFRSRHVDRPVISVGNITTGGTGKTPVVRWLVQQLIDAGRCPAILTRGYKGGDEQRLLQSQLPGTIVQANPSRIDGAKDVLGAHPRVDVFVLDDGFQHRKIRRDFDLVLIDASQPFGFGQVLPRGRLREPLASLARASAFLITHTELADPDGPVDTLLQHNFDALAYRCRHVQTGYLDCAGAPVSLESVRGTTVLAFCGIGNPSAFLQGQRIAVKFGDHHQYTVADLQQLRDRARQAGAELMVTTEKDWVKLEPLVGQLPDLPPVLRAQLEVRFEADDERRLFNQIIRAIDSSRARSAAPAGAAGA